MERLQRIRELLERQGHQAGDAVLALFSLHGFHPDVLRAAGLRDDLVLVDLAALYGDAPVLGGT
ncbi:hypothetical protein [Rhizohabitans arisaemae]|uniref:hypothetical protein n=1 Tax=Rhizohabitans arisaemae TaxID=2720610 RepID=UPI0024B20250|nr:hypothetical protein [Rhizohabitans arisaemae]